MYCISCLVNSASLNELIRCITLTKVIFCSSISNTSVKNAILSMNAEFRKLGSGASSKDDMDAIDEDIDEVKIDEILSDAHQPFGAFIKMKIENVEVFNSGPEKNAMFSPDFFKYLEKNWFPMAPFWSGMLLGMCQYILETSISNSYILGDVSRYVPQYAQHSDLDVNARIAKVQDINI